MELFLYRLILYKCKGVDEMELKGNSNDNINMQQLYDDCKLMMNYHVVIRMRDGREMDGIIESVDPDSVNMLVGEDVIL